MFIAKSGRRGYKLNSNSFILYLQIGEDMSFKNPRNPSFDFSDAEDDAETLTDNESKSDDSDCEIIEPNAN
jgi:hypothetical protein